MYEELWVEIQEMQGEIFDIPDYILDQAYRDMAVKEEELQLQVK